mgnify:CR=1 FL=1
MFENHTNYYYSTIIRIDRCNIIGISTLCVAGACVEQLALVVCGLCPLYVRGVPLFAGVLG